MSAQPAIAIRRCIPSEGRLWALGWMVVLVTSAGAALLISAALDRSTLALMVAAAVLLAVVIARGVRALGSLGFWLVAMLFAILLGEMSSVSLGGQHGRLLWADAILVVGAVGAMIRNRLVVSVPRAPFLDFLWPFLAWCAIGMLFARDPLSCASELKEWCAAAAVGVAAAWYAREARQARILLGAISALGALIGLHMAYVAITSPFSMLYAIYMKLVDLPWGRTNYLAGILIAAMSVNLGLIGYERSLGKRMLWLAALLATATGLLLSTSKGALMALVLGLATCYGLGRQASRAPRWIMLAVLAVGAGLYTAGPLQEVSRYHMQQSALDYSVSERVNLYRLAWSSFTSHPILGLGIDNFSVRSHHLRGLDTVPHNFALGFLAETGLPGFLMVSAWVLAMGMTAWRCRTVAATPRDRSLALGLWGAFVGFVVHNQVESTLYGQQFKMVLMVLAASTWRLSLQGTPDPSGKE